VVAVFRRIVTRCVPARFTRHWAPDEVWNAAGAESGGDVMEQLAAVPSNHSPHFTLRTRPDDGRTGRADAGVRGAGDVVAAVVHSSRLNSLFCSEGGETSVPGVADLELSACSGMLVLAQ
jgi:hypothetical protein